MGGGVSGFVEGFKSYKASSSAMSKSQVETASPRVDTVKDGTRITPKPVIEVWKLGEEGMGYGV